MKKCLGKKLKKNIFILSLSWIIIVGISFTWNYKYAKHEQNKIALWTSRAFFEQIIITREWNARHGGVYVPVTSETQPNPYLKGSLRDIKVNKDLLLTKVNPAFMTRQLSEIALKANSIKFHITSLNPIRPANKPTSMEKEALQSFRKGKKEVGKIIKNDNNSTYFYMAPLITEKECLKCHAEQGYQIGDIRGGISVTLPFVAKIHLLPLLGGHAFIGILGLTGIFVPGIRLDKAYKTIKKQAVIDSLTNIPNQRNFSERILTEFQRSKRDIYPLSLIMADIDNFKAYNDNYGHEAGNHCLQKIAKTINDSLKRPYDFCARYGGEEFVIILPQTDLKGAEVVAENIRKNIYSLKIPNIGSQTEKIVTLSLGVSTFDGKNSVSYEKLIKQADNALYEAKEKGKNQTVTIPVNYPAL